MSDMPAVTTLKGGPGSGNFGHAGRQGKHGGSAPKSGEGAVMSIRTGKTAEMRQAKRAGLYEDLVQRAKNTPKSDFDRYAAKWEPKRKAAKNEMDRLIRLRRKDRAAYEREGGEEKLGQAVIDLSEAEVKLDIMKYRKFAKDDDMESQSKEIGLSVFKDKTGRYRWISISSNAFQDHDLEIVSTKALEEDVDRADREGDYGPLRWWHMAGVDIGDCDFNMMAGRMLVESGTFRDERIGQAIKESGKDYQVSIGFNHPRSEPVLGVFNHIRRFERSLLPAGRASNGLTAFLVKGKEVDDMATQKEKESVLRDLVGDDLADKVLTEAASREKSAVEAGTAFKEADAETTKGKMPPEVLAALQKKNGKKVEAEEGEETPVDEAAETEEEEVAEAEAGTEKPIKGKKVMAKAAVKKESDEDDELDALLAELEEDEDEEGTKEAHLPEFLGDVPTSQFAGMLAGAIANAFQPFFETQKEIVTSLKEIKEMGGMTTKEAGAMAEKVAHLEEAAATQARALLETRKRLKEAVGDMPKAAKEYRASEADDTVTTKEVAGPVNDPFATFAQEFVFKGVTQ